MSAPSYSGRLTSTDASFLYLERKDAPMHIGAVAILDGEIPFEDYLANIAIKLRRLPRLRERAVAAPFFVGHPTWETDPDFDIRKHVFEHRIPSPGGETELKATADKLIEAMLERDRPLWEFHILQGLEGGRSAIVSKVHHAMVDGVGGNQILMALFDLSPKAKTPAIEDEYEPTAPATSRERLTNALWDNARTAMDAFGEAQRGILERTRGLDRERVRSTLDVMRSTLPDLALPPKRLPFNKSCGGGRHFTWTTFSFAEARAARSALGGTVNDVILAALAGAVSRYCEHHRVDTRGRTLRVMVPVNVRPEAEAAGLGNLVSILPVDLPLDIDDPQHRVGVIRETTRILKRGHVADGISSMSNLMGMVPPPIQAAFGALAATPFPLFNIVCTNVPGPQIPLYAMGHRLTAYYPYIPVGFDMGVGCAIFSYDQTLHIGLNSDTTACPDVERLRDCFAESIQEIKDAAGVETIERVDIGKSPAPPHAAGASQPSAEKDKGDKAAARKKSKAKKGKAQKSKAKKAKKSKAKKGTKPGSTKKRAARGRSRSAESARA